MRIFVEKNREIESDFLRIYDKMEEIMGKIKHSYSPEEKVRIVLEELSYPDGIARYCRSKGIRDTLFYKWKNQLEKGAKNIFGSVSKGDASEIKLREEMVRKDTIISELVHMRWTIHAIITVRWRTG